MRPILRATHCRPGADSHATFHPYRAISRYHRISFSLLTFTHAPFPHVYIFSFQAHLQKYRFGSGPGPGTDDTLLTLFPNLPLPLPPNTDTQQDEIPWHLAPYLLYQPNYPSPHALFGREKPCISPLQKVLLGRLFWRSPLARFSSIRSFFPQKQSRSRLRVTMPRFQYNSSMRLVGCSLACCCGRMGGRSFYFLFFDLGD